MPAFSRITVFSGSACLSRLGRSASRSCTAACQTQRALQRRTPSTAATNRSASFKATAGVTPKRPPGLLVPVSRHCSMSSMSQRMVWVDLEVRRCLHRPGPLSLTARVKGQLVHPEIFAHPQRNAIETSLIHLNVSFSTYGPVKLFFSSHNLDLHLLTQPIEACLLWSLFIAVWIRIGVFLRVVSMVKQADCDWR